MIIPGQDVVEHQIVTNLQAATQQQQPCGVDLTLKSISQWTSAAAIDFDNTKRQAAKVAAVPFDATTQAITLSPGAYLVDFNEVVQVPQDAMGSVFPRSSLWRSGVTISAGVVDAGYQGAMGALMLVNNPHGVLLHKDAKLAQIVLHKMEREVEGYKGIYQASKSSAGLNGAAA